MADEYISREAAKAVLKWNEHRFTCADEANGFGEVKWSEYVIYADTAQNCIDKIPAADVAPIVRCKDCKHSYEDLMGRCCAFGACVDCIVPDDFFCAYGVKMDESEGKNNV